MTSTDTTLLHVAIDFGTTFSGYAFRFKQQKEIQVCKKLGGANLGFESYKVPTCVLTDDNDKFIAFGYDAQNLYSKEESDGDSDDENEDSDSKPAPKAKKLSDEFKTPFHFYDEFKMMLQSDREKEIDSNMPLKAYDEHSCPAIKIFAMALKFLKQNLLDVIKQQIEDNVKDNEILWILTVPAIWSDKAKQFMRECAIEAEIVSKDNSDQLLIALEPEAASLYCRTLLQVDKFQVKHNINSEEIKKGLPKDTQYMVVDCGGGTVDVTAHHYKSNGDICELFAASGGGWGGRNVNLQFEKKLNEVLRKEFISECKKQFSSAYLHIKTRFEKEKRSITLNNATDKYHFACPLFFDSLCRSTFKKPMEKLVKETQTHTDEANNVGFYQGTLKFPVNVMKNVFEPPIKDIKTHILDLISREELKDIKYIYLVGGFSDCIPLQNVIQKEFKTGPYTDRNIQVVLAPYEASLSVVKGAVLFGTNPQAIASRRAQRYYCTCSNAPNASTRVNSSGKKRLVPMVEQNEEIYNDDVRHTHIIPYYDGKIFKLYHYKIDVQTKSKRNFKYSDDRDVDYNEIDVSDIVGENCTKDTKISIYLYFGSTEIHITARNDKEPGSKAVTKSISCVAHYKGAKPHNA